MIYRWKNSGKGKNLKSKDKCKQGKKPKHILHVTDLTRSIKMEEDVLCFNNNAIDSMNQKDRM